jgi:hypothetical protein
MSGHPLPNLQIHSFWTHIQSLCSSTRKKQIADGGHSLKNSAVAPVVASVVLTFTHHTQVNRRHTLWGISIVAADFKKLALSAHLGCALGPSVLDAALPEAPCPEADKEAAQARTQHVR